MPESRSPAPQPSNDPLLEEGVPALPPELQRQLARAGADLNDPKILLAMAVARKYSGPIPSPEMLNAYRSVHPDLPEKIIAWTEAQTAHRQKLEALAVSASEQRRSRGQLFTFGIACLGL
jgi:uncharacterized membrane protein